MGLIVISDRDEAFIERMRALLERERDYKLALAPTPAKARDLALRDKAQVVVIGPSAPADAALAIASELAQALPPISVVLIVQRVTTELLRQALRSGVSDVLSASGQTYGEVAKAVREAHDAALARAQAVPVATQPAPDATPHAARMVTVFGTKGGVGKSVLATNLAVALAADKQRKVVLVDLALESGDDGIMLNVQPAHTILDAAQAVDRLDTAMLRGLFVTHASGVQLLMAPVRPEDAELVTAAKVGRILDLVRQVADVVIVDTPSKLDELVLTAIDKSDVVLAVSTMDMPSVKNMRVALQKLGQLGYRNGLVRLVLNRADSKVLLEVADVEEALAGRVFAKIPSDRLVPRSVNKGVPIVTDAPKSGVARSIVELADAVMADEEAK